jgi:predicted lipid-binding transport protein (Tim44 family)
MRRTSMLLAAVAVLGLDLVPTLADARAGSSGSMGSRGSRTFSAPPSTNTSPGMAQPMQRSVTPSTPSPSPGFAGAAAPARSGFMSGMMGGLLGAGLIGMMFGGGMFSGMSGFGGFLGFLIQIVLVVFLARLAFKWFRSRQQPAMAGGPSMFSPGGSSPGGGGAAGGPLGGLMGGGRPAAPASGSNGMPINIAPGDYQAFEQLLKNIQAGWTAQDPNALKALTTPEMFSYFGEQIADQNRRGVRNSVTDVNLQQGDLAEAWTEQGRDYATVAMKFSMIDVTTDVSGRVIDGSPTEHVTATELWTFLRVRGGGWTLSAIQQSR